MDEKKNRTVTSWVFLYAALFAAVFASQSGATTPPDAGALSPVILQGEPPALKINAVVRRSDI